MNGSKVFPPIVDPFSPKRFKMSRQENNSSIALTKQIQMNGGTYYFGSQTVSYHEYSNGLMIIMMDVMIWRY